MPVMRRVRRLKGRVDRGRIPRWRCSSGRRFTSLTETVLEHCRRPFAAWISFIRLTRRNVRVEFEAELCGVTHKIFFEWRNRVLATVSSYRDRIVLRDTVWVDEIYINDTDLSKGYGRARKRGLFRQKPRICVVVEIHKNPVVIVCDTESPVRCASEGPWAARLQPGRCSFKTSSGPATCWSGTMGSRAKRAGLTSTVLSTWSGWRW